MQTPSKYEAAKAVLARQPHSAYVSRVEAILEEKEERVLLFQTWRMARRNNTSNYSEVSNRIKPRLKGGVHPVYFLILPAPFDTASKHNYSCQILLKSVTFNEF